MTRRASLALLSIVGAVLLFAIACAGSANDESGGGEQSSAARVTPDSATAAADVAVGPQPPRNRVASTGAHLPANGKPTLVFVDAIW